MSEYKIGDLIVVTGTTRVFRLTGFTEGFKTIPDGFLLGGGSAINPKFCRKYNGAESVLSGAVRLRDAGKGE
jgi:hypothetical protein